MCGGSERRLRPVMNELAYNLESFNPAFTAVLLQARQTCRTAGQPEMQGFHWATWKVSCDVLS